MDTFTYFKSKLDHAISHSIRASLFFQEPQFVQDCLEFEGMNVWCGISRGCIVSDDWNFVVKFSLDEDVNGDCCERECKFWENAADSNLDMYFAEPKYIGRYKWHGNAYPSREVFRDLYFDWNDSEEDIEEDIVKEGIEKKEISIYLDLYEYPKARLVEDWCVAPDIKITEWVRKSGSSFGNKNANVAAFFVETYGEDEFLRVSDFLEWNGINDLHSGNIGFIGDRLVFIDYAGWFEDYSKYSAY